MSRLSDVASEPSEQAEFVPLSAEFAPQMTLFGSAPQATAIASSSTRLPAQRGGAAGRVRAPRRPARGAQPPRCRPAPPRRTQPP